MTSSELALPTEPLTALTVYSCDRDEATLFGAESARFGISPVITAEAVSAATIPLAQGSRCISVGHKTHITKKHLLALSKVGVQYISTRSVGTNHIDIAYAETVGITVSNVQYSPDSVADYTLMLMLMTVRHAKSVLLRADKHDYRLSDPRGKELRDLTVGVIGTGRIGSAVIDRLRGFGTRIIAHDRQQKADVEYGTLDEVLRQSDIVTLHAPLDETTRNLLDHRRLAQLKPGAYIVNTGRGGLIDTAALITFLEAGVLGGVALDVVEGEDGIFYGDHRETALGNNPLVRLRELSNAIITPHSAYFTEHALHDTVVNSLTNCAQFERESHHV